MKIRPRAIREAFHVVEQANWPSVQRHGLLSASRLMQRAGEPPSAQRRHRQVDLTLTSGAIIRDQKPMPPHRLQVGLCDGLTPDDWFEILNSKVFFWLDPKRVDGHRGAYSSRPQLILIIDAAAMLDRYAGAAFVSPINSGNARRRPTLRNRTTFVPYARWVSDAWAHEVIPGRATRAASHTPVELAIEDGFPDALDYIREVIELDPKESFASKILAR
jgi:hypothetical protein